MMESSRKDRQPRRQIVTGRGAAFAAALVLVAALTASTSALASRSAAGAGGGLKACGYMLSSSGGSTIEYVRIADTAAPGAKGTFLFRGPGANETKHLVLNNKGLALTSFPVSVAGTETLAVTLATKPTATGTFHFTLNPAATDVAGRTGCTPR